MVLGLLLLRKILRFLNASLRCLIQNLQIFYVGTIACLLLTTIKGLTNKKCFQLFLWLTKLNYVIKKLNFFVLNLIFYKCGIKLFKVILTLLFFIPHFKNMRFDLKKISLEIKFFLVISTKLVSLCDKL